MKVSCIAAAALVLAAPAMAGPATPPIHGICIDPHYSYQARYLSGNEIVAKATLGKDHRELKLSTTCIGLRREDHLSLSSAFSCIGVGDDVVATKIDGHRQSCRITHVAPFPATAPEPRG